MNTQTTPTVSEIVTRLGGQSKTAEIFGIKQPSIAEWVKNNEIPPARLMYLRLARPDVFQPSVAS